LQIRTSDEKRRNKAHGATRKDGERESEAENGVVDVDAVDSRELGRQECGEDANAVIRESDAGESANHAEDERLAEELAHEARTAGAERGADGNFARARCRPREQKIGDVGARNQKDEADGTEQDEQGCLHFTDEKIAQRYHANRPAVVVLGIIFREPRGDGVELGFGLRRVHARLDAAGERQPVTAAPIEPASEQRIIDDWHPDLVALLQLREAERCGRDADDGEGALVERDRSADDGGIGGK